MAQRNQSVAGLHSSRQAQASKNPPALLRYDAACKALAEAKAIDEVKNVRDVAVAMAHYARQAKNRDLEADAVEIRMRATRRLDQLRQAQKDSVGLATGGEHGGRTRIDGVRNTPSIVRPTLAQQGIDKNLAKHARALGALSPERFEQAVADARSATTRAFRNVVNAAVIEQEREQYRARTEHGATIADLETLIKNGKRFGVIYPDLPWPFETYSEKGKQRSAERHYDTMSLDQIKALPVQALAAEDCALLLWVTWPGLDAALDVIRAWGFAYRGCSFLWVKTTEKADCIKLNGAGLHWGMGYHTRANTEPCLLAVRGTPLRLAKDVHQVVMAAVTEHSEKPEEVARRIERLYGGPYLELFARRPREGWTTWGNEVERSVAQTGANE
jgi:N6-adenosine-specific RNA methylase IME4